MKNKILKTLLINFAITFQLYAMNFPADKLVIIEGDTVNNCVNNGGKAVNTKEIPGKQDIVIEKANGIKIARSHFIFQCKIGKHLGSPLEYSALIKSYYFDENEQDKSKRVAEIRKKITGARNKVTRKCFLNKDGASTTCTDEETGEVKRAINDPNSIANMTRNISERLGITETPEEETRVDPDMRKNWKMFQKSGEESVDNGTSN